MDPGEEGLDILNVPGDRACIRFDKEGRGIRGFYLFLDDTSYVVTNGDVV